MDILTQISCSSSSICKTLPASTANSVNFYLQRFIIIFSFTYLLHNLHLENVSSHISFLAFPIQSWQQFLWHFTKQHFIVCMTSRVQSFTHFAIGTYSTSLATEGASVTSVTGCAGIQHCSKFIE